MQSPFTRHPHPAGHFWTQDPPQLMSVSSPFCQLSKHDGAAHVLIPAPTHSLLAQSAKVLQVAPVGQAIGHTAPQSLSLSPPFFTPSLQLAAAQIPAVQTW